MVETGMQNEGIHFNSEECERRIQISRDRKRLPE